MLREFVHVEPGHCIGLCGGVMVAYSDRQLGPIELQRFAEIGRTRLVGDLHHFAIVTVLGERASMSVNKASRAGMVELIREFEPRTLAAGIVVLGSSFRATLMRSLATTLVLMSWSPKPIHVFSEVREAADWYAELFADPELSSALEAFYGELAQLAQLGISRAS